MVCALGCLCSLLLVPHTVVCGVPDYVNYSLLFSPRTWRPNAERYVTLQYTGAAHPYKQHAFCHALLDLAVRITLPAITTLSTAYPLFQVVAIALVGLAHLVASVI